MRVAEDVPVLPAVPAETASEADPRYGRSAAVGFVVGVLLVTAAITLAGTIGGMGFGPALGLGACAGIWGGGGFGFLLGATLPVARHFDEEAAR
jgi:hypothetical protein